MNKPKYSIGQSVMITEPKKEPFIGIIVKISRIGLDKFPVYTTHSFLEGCNVSGVYLEDRLTNVLPYTANEDVFDESVYRWIENL